MADDSRLDDISDAIARIAHDQKVKPANNDFEGRDTLRIDNLLAYGGVFRENPVDDRVLPMVEGVLDPGCLISSTSRIREMNCLHA